MATHRGWRVTETNEGTFRGWARDPATKKYKCKNFKTRKLANEWAKEQAARFELGQERITALLDARPSQRYLDMYLAELARLGRNDDHRKEVQRVLAQVVRIVAHLEDDSTTDRIRTWLTEWSDRSVATQNRVLGYVKAWVKWCIVEGHFTANTVARIRPLKAPKRVKPQFTLDELHTLLQAIDDPYHLRFCFLIYAGLRVTELHTLRWSDIDRRGGVMRVIGKGNKERLVPLQPELAAVITYYLTAAEYTPHQFVAGAAHEQFRDKWRRQFLSFLKRHHVSAQGRSPHSTRHCYAGMMSACRCAPFVLAHYMGHEDTETTKGYSELAARYAQEASAWPNEQLQILTGWVCQGRIR